MLRRNTGPIVRGFYEFLSITRERDSREYEAIRALFFSGNLARWADKYFSNPGIFSRVEMEKASATDGFISGGLNFVLFFRLASFFPLWTYEVHYSSTMYTRIRVFYSLRVVSVRCGNGLRGSCTWCRIYYRCHFS